MLKVGSKLLVDVKIKQGYKIKTTNETSFDRKNTLVYCENGPKTFKKNSMKNPIKVGDFDSEKNKYIN